MSASEPRRVPEKDEVARSSTPVHLEAAAEAVIPAPPGLEGAWGVFKRGLAESPELRIGLVYTVLLAMVSALGSLLIPVLIQQVLDRGLAEGFRAGFVYGVCGAAAAAIIIVYVASRAAFARMVAASEGALAALRVRTFAHVHRLSIAEQTETRRGTFVSRVTSDIDTLSLFMEWGAIWWITGSTLALGTIVVMFFYSWQLTLVVLASVAPMFFVMRRLQAGMLAAYDVVRTRVAEMLAEISESVMGAAVIRAYGLGERIDTRLRRAIRRRYEAQLHAKKFQAAIFPMSDLFGGIALGAVLAVGVWRGPDWGLTSGRLVAFLFLVHLFVTPLGELSETFDQTQTAIAGWRKVLAVLDLPVEVVEPSPGVVLPSGPLAVRAEGVHFAYRDGLPVLRGIDVEMDPGARVAIVGETGCGKTTFAKLLCRLTDPSAGRIAIGGVDLRNVSPESRRAAIRMVPQDGFLFDTTIRANIAFGKPGAADSEVESALDDLGLGEWAARLGDGLETRAGERGGNLSVGECQLVALARAHIAGPGVLILDEATSAVDPETEVALTEALKRVAEGRTTITIAHRLSTAEAAEFVLVFDRGRIVERGDHASLVAAGGVYASLYQSWLGNTRV
ncbi:MAG: ABC transporter ATP-binding protein [Actinomycetota bacterium]